MLIASVKRRIRRSQFEPGLIGLLVNPFYIARSGLLSALRRLSRHVTGRTLDVGCGQKPYRHLFASTEYIGLELDTPENRMCKQADYFYDGRTFPFDSGSFDSVVCSQVLEHVFEPSAFLSEIHRVLKPGGVLLLTVPFVWDEHEQPFDFARYSTFGLRYVLERAGFRVDVLEKSVADGRLLFQLANAMAYKRWRSVNRWRMLLITVVAMAPVNVMAVVFGKLVPASHDLYLDNVVVARKAVA
jgi:SAM-dependent methyltransferase